MCFLCGCCVLYLNHKNTSLKTCRLKTFFFKSQLLYSSFDDCTKQGICRGYLALTPSQKIRGLEELLSVSRFNEVNSTIFADELLMILAGSGRLEKREHVFLLFSSLPAFSLF